MISNSVRDGRGRILRSVESRPERKRFLIVCEGKTETIYFDGFRINKEISGAAKNTLGIVDDAIELMRERGFSSSDECWCVFDKDDFPKDHFNSAIAKADANGIKVAYSNPCFELWFLLHWDYIDSACSRSSFEERLSRKLGCKYEKTNLQIIGVFWDRKLTMAAIRNAKRLYEFMLDKQPADADPSTTVHELVRIILANEV